MTSYFFVPPLTRVSGGLGVIYQIAEILHQAGQPACLVCRDETTPGLAQTEVPVLSWDELTLTPNDIWVVPEGWPNALVPGLEVGCCNVVYVQNWAYLLSTLPQGVRWQQFDVTFLAVSTPVAAFIKEIIGADSIILRPGLDLNLFCPNPATGNAKLLKDTASVKSLNVGWMPRKNKAVAVQARQILEARGRLGVHLRWLEINGKTRNEVAEMLQECHLYLGTGFPEGLGLPPLEAMACGVIPVTCAGYGGWDYLRQIPPDLCKEFDFSTLKSLPGLIAPEFKQIPGLPTLPLHHNAFVTPDADPLCMAVLLEYAASLILAKDPVVQQILDNGQAAARAYSHELQEKNTLAVWKRLEEQRQLSPN